MRRTRFLLALAALGCALAAPSAAPAATITVETFDDVNDSGDEQCSLREAVNAANDPAATAGGDCEAGAREGSDVIVLQEGTYGLAVGDRGEDSNAEGDLDVKNLTSVTLDDDGSADVTFVGQGDAATFIDADGIDRAIDVQSDGNLSSVDVAIEDLTIKNGIAAEIGEDGGAVNMRDANGQLTLDGVTIRDSYADRWGGAVNFANATNGLGHPLEILDSEIVSNISGGKGGGVYTKNSGDQGSTLVYRSTFEHNDSGASGGAIYLAGDSNSGRIDMVNSTVTGNTAASGGSGIGMGQPNVNLYVYFSTVADNATDAAEGAGIHGDNTGQFLFAAGSILSGNTANGAAMNCRHTSGGTAWIASDGYNLESANTCGFTAAGDLTDTDPALGALAENGGPTRTRAIGASSPAFNRVVRSGSDVCSKAAGVDQRGAARPAATDGLCDVGAFELADADSDGVLDATDNCAITSNPGQANLDGDPLGDACDPDDDNDGFGDEGDNCPATVNADQADTDGDREGNACDSDDDDDSVADGTDNCPTVANAGQANLDGDSSGDACDSDDDNDGVGDGSDNCPTTANADQANSYGDARGDACETAPTPAPETPAPAPETPAPAPEPPAPTPETPAPQPDTSAPRLSILSVGGTSTGRIRFRLSEAAIVVFKVYQRKAGRSVGGRCVRSTRANARRPRCNLLLPGSFSRQGRTGSNNLRFSGRLNGRKLAAGRYSLVATPKDAAGNTGASQRFLFSIPRSER